MYTSNYVALISKAQGHCGVKASLQPPMNLAIQIKFLIYSNSISGGSKSETRELSRVQSFFKFRDNQPKRNRPKH